MTVETRFKTENKCIVDTVITNDGEVIIALMCVDETRYQICMYKAHESYMIQSYDILGKYVKAIAIE